MKRIKIHSSRFIHQLQTQGPIFSIIEVEDKVYESIVSSGHIVEVFETLKPEPTKLNINKLKFKPKKEEVKLEEEITEIKEELIEFKEEEQVKEEVIKTELSTERLAPSIKTTNKGRKKYKK